MLRDVVKVFPVSSSSFARKMTGGNRARSQSHCAKWAAKPTHFDLTGAQPANRSSPGFGHLHRNLTHTKSMAFSK